MKLINKNYKIALILISICFFAQAQSKQTFKITGYLSGLQSGTILHLVHNNSAEKPDTLQSIYPQNEQFQFKGTLPLEGEAYFIFVDTQNVKYEQKIKGKNILILMEAANIRVDGSIYDLTKINIRGSKAHDEFLLFSKARASFVDSLNIYNRKFFMLATAKDSSEQAKTGRFSAKKQLDSVKNIYNNFRKSWIAEHLNSLTSAKNVTWVYKDTEDTKWLFDTYDKLSDRVKQSRYGIDLKKQINLIKSTMTGAIAPDLKLETPVGNLLAISEVTKRNKLTLIDFWTFWCVPCRESFPDLKITYEKYKNKGFGILGISPDPRKDEWRKAIVDIGLVWENLIYENKQIDPYGIKSVPTSFLVDSSSKIIASWSGKNKELNKLIETYLTK